MFYKFKVFRILFLVGIYLMISCVKTDDFEVPKVEFEAPNITANSNILAIKKAFDQSGVTIYTFDESDDAVMEGYVISSDEAGNFYKRLIIQDHYENPTSGIEILIDVRAYYTKYNLGRKLWIPMAGLSVTGTEGIYKIGLVNQNKITEIPASLVDNYLIRSTETEVLTPLSIEIPQFSKELLNTYVEVDHMQFGFVELGKTFAGEPYDNYNGERNMIQCNTLLSTVLSTNTFADFKSNLITAKSGTIEAVFTKDFYLEKYVLVVNNPEALNFINEERCDPEFLNCEGEISSGNQIIFAENFENITKTKDLETLGWINQNLYFGNERFTKGTDKGNVIVRVSAYGSEENPMEAWLITPKINLKNSINPVLKFDTQAYYDNGKALTIWVSQNFNGNIQEAHWQQLNANIPVGPSNSYESQFISSGTINLSCLSGDIVIGFKYQGSDPGITTTYEIDNVRITSE